MQSPFWRQTCKERDNVDNKTSLESGSVVPQMAVLLGTNIQQYRFRQEEGEKALQG